MAIRNIIFSDDGFIRKKSRPVVEFDEKLGELLDDMKDTMTSNIGCGIAAPQVGVLKRAILVETCNMFLELVNPVIVRQSGKQCSEEGCLSVKELVGMVERPQKLTVTAQDRHGTPFSMTVEGQMAIVISHEVDHLNGVLFIDKAVELYNIADRPKDSSDTEQ